MMEELYKFLQQKTESTPMRFPICGTKIGYFFSDKVRNQAYPRPDENIIDILEDELMHEVEKEFSKNTIVDVIYLPTFKTNMSQRAELALILRYILSFMGRVIYTLRDEKIDAFYKSVRHLEISISSPRYAGLDKTDVLRMAGDGFFAIRRSLEKIYRYKEIWFIYGELRSKEITFRAYDKNNTKINLASIFGAEFEGSESGDLVVSAGDGCEDGFILGVRVVPLKEEGGKFKYIPERRSESDLPYVNLADGFI